MTGLPEWQRRLLDWLPGQAPLLLLPESAQDARPGALIEEAGFEPVVIDFSTIADKNDLMAAMRQALGLDAWFGANWDALGDALHGPELPMERPRVLVLQVPPSGLGLADEEFRTLLEIVCDVAGAERSTLRGAVVACAGSG